MANNIIPVLLGIIISINSGVVVAEVTIGDITRQEHAEQITGVLTTHWLTEKTQDAQFLFQPAPTANSVIANSDKLQQSAAQALVGADFMQKAYTDKYIYQTGLFAVVSQDAFDRHLNDNYCSAFGRLMECAAEIKPYADLLPGTIFNKLTLESGVEQQAALNLMLNLVGDSNETVNNLIQEGDNISDNIKNQAVVGKVFKEAAVVALARQVFLDAITARMPQKDSDANVLPSVHQAFTDEVLKRYNNVDGWHTKMAAAHPAAVMREMATMMAVQLKQLDNMGKALAQNNAMMATLLGQIVEMKQRMSSVPR